MQAVRGFSQIAAQKQQLGFQQVDRHAEDLAGAKPDRPDQGPQLAQPAAATNSPSGALQGTSTGQLLPNSCKKTCKETFEAGTGTAVRCWLQHTAVNSPAAPSSLMAANSHLQLPQPDGQSQQLASSRVKPAEQSISAQPSRPVLNDGCIQQPASTHDAEHDAKVRQGFPRSGSRLAEPSSQSRSLPVSRTLKKRAAPQPDTIACKQANEISKSADIPQSVSQLAQGQDGRTMPAKTHGATARAKQAVASTDDADGLVRAMPQQRASKAPARALTCASRPAGKAHAARKASPAAAVVSQARDNPAGSSAEAQQSQREPVSRRSLRSRQAHTTAAVNSSSEHDSNISNFADESSDADSAAELRAGASRRERADKAGMTASKVACASKRQISASVGRKASRQHVSSTDEEAEDTALLETAVCDSEADDGGTDEVLRESSEDDVARSGKTARLPAQNGVQMSTGGQQAKQAAARPGRGGRGGAAGTGRGGYRRTATRQNFVRSNLKASCIKYGCKTRCAMQFTCDWNIICDWTIRSLRYSFVHPSSPLSFRPSVHVFVNSSIHPNIHHPAIHSLHAHSFLMGTYKPLKEVN